MDSPTIALSSVPKTGTCQRCGATVEPVLVHNGEGDSWWTPRYCQPCLDAAIDAREREEDAAAEAERLAKRLAAIGIPPRLGDATLDNFAARAGTERVLAAARAMVDDWPETRGLVLMGPPGTGKSHLAAGIAKAVVTKGAWARWVSPARLALEVEAAYRTAQRTELAILDELLMYDLLVLDDLGADKATEKRTERLYVLINDAYERHRHLVLTTNARSLDDLVAHLGERTVDRLVEDCTVIAVAATSYRQERAARQVGGDRQ